jgi:DNA-binding transcriptional regulator YiaG
MLDPLVSAGLSGRVHGDPRKKSRVKKVAWRGCDGEEFSEARALAGFTRRAAARLLWVCERTVWNWEKRRTAVPYSAFKLMRILSGYALPGEAWKGWTIRGDTLWSPTGRAFESWSMGYLGLVFAMARHWLRDRGYTGGIPASPGSAASLATRAGRVGRPIAPGNPRPGVVPAQRAGTPGACAGGRDLPGQPLAQPLGIHLPDGADLSLGLSLYNKSSAEGRFHRGNDSGAVVKKEAVS